MRKILSVLLFIVAGAVASEAAAQTGPLQYYALTPCRIADTRNATGTNGGPALQGGVRRDFAVRGRCGVPTTARAVSLNLTVTGASTNSHITIWPSGTAMPNVSTINFGPNDPAVANGAIVGLSTATLDLSAFNAAGTVHLIIDVTGYFQ
jgi:hypothetical protein